MAREPVRQLRMGSDLPDTHWKQLHDQRWPGRRAGKIDHLLVGPSGVFVINYCTSSQAQESLAATDAVADLLPARYRTRARPVVCSCADAERAEMVGNVLVTTSPTLEHIVRASHPVLSTSEVAEVFAILHARMEPVPLDPPVARNTWPLRRKLVAWAVAAAAVVGAVALGPDVVEVSRIW